MARIVLAPTQFVELYPAGLREVLNFLGHPEALVTDLSTVEDFAGDEEDTGMTALVDDFLFSYGVDIRERPYLWQIAKELEERGLVHE